MIFCYLLVYLHGKASFDEHRCIKLSSSQIYVLVDLSIISLLQELLLVQSKVLPLVFLFFDHGSPVLSLSISLPPFYYLLSTDHFIWIKLGITFFLDLLSVPFNLLLSLPLHLQHLSVIAAIFIHLLIEGAHLVELLLHHHFLIFQLLLVQLISVWN